MWNKNEILQHIGNEIYECKPLPITTSFLYSNALKQILQLIKK